VRPILGIFVSEMQLLQKKIQFPFIFIVLLVPNIVFAQPMDSIPVKDIHNQKQEIQLLPQEKKFKIRKLAITGLNVVGYGGALLALNNTWYKNFPREKLHSFNDSKEWLQMDKAGHVFSAYFEGKYSMELWRWAGLERKARIWIGGLSGAAYQTIIEFLDGTSAQWGWSWADFGANCIGSGLLIGQELAWNEQRIHLKLGYSTEKYDASVLTRVHELFGKTGTERLLKDYNGQTYWISANLRAFFPHSRLPRWLNIAAGYGATGLLGGFENKWTDAVGNEIVRTDIKRQRQWYLSPEIDLTRIKTNKVALKVLFQILNMIRVPLPALEITGGKAKLKALSF
jgi:hypothetical protein